MKKRYIEIKTPEDLKDYTHCPDCGAKLTYKNSSCYCLKEHKEFTFWLNYEVSQMQQ
jgi:hypothetical protein